VTVLQGRAGNFKAYFASNVPNTKSAGQVLFRSLGLLQYANRDHVNCASWAKLLSYVSAKPTKTGYWREVEKRFLHQDSTTQRTRISLERIDESDFGRLHRKMMLLVAIAGFQAKNQVA
jgi:hypothetical protein